MRHFPLTKTDWRSERLKGGSESEGSRRGEERAWNCSRSAWPSFPLGRRSRGCQDGAAARSPGGEVGRERHPRSLALPWGTVQAGAQARARAASSQRGALCCQAFRHADRWSYWKGVRTNHRHLILRTSSMDRKHPPCCHLVLLRPRRRPSCLTVRVQPAFHLLP